MSEARGRMVASAVVLLARHGVQATSFSAVLDGSGAPRGSIYHHFPGGKDQLIAAAIDLAGQRAIVLLDSLAGLPPEGVVEGSCSCGARCSTCPASRRVARCWQ